MSSHRNGTKQSSQYNMCRCTTRWIAHDANCLSDNTTWFMILYHDSLISIQFLRCCYVSSFSNTYDRTCASTSDLTCTPTCALLFAYFDFCSYFRFHMCLNLMCCFPGIIFALTRDISVHEPLLFMYALDMFFHIYSLRSLLFALTSDMAFF